MAIALLQKYCSLAPWTIAIHVWQRRQLILMDTALYRHCICDASGGLDSNHRSPWRGVLHWRVSNLYVGGAYDLDPELSR